MMCEPCAGMRSGNLPAGFRLRGQIKSNQMHFLVQRSVHGTCGNIWSRVTAAAPTATAAAPTATAAGGIVTRALRPRASRAPIREQRMAQGLLGTCQVCSRAPSRLLAPRVRAAGQKAAASSRTHQLARPQTWHGSYRQRHRSPPRNACPPPTDQRRLCGAIRRSCPPLW